MSKKIFITYRPDRKAEKHQLVGIELSLTTTVKALKHGISSVSAHVRNMFLNLQTQLLQTIYTPK